MNPDVVASLTKLIGKELLGVSHDEDQCLLVFDVGALLFKCNEETKIVGHDVVLTAVRNRLDVISQTIQERKTLTELLEKIKR